MHGKGHGQGSLVYINGDKYEGEWKDDNMHGNGKFTYVFGLTFEGTIMTSKLVEGQLIQ